MSAHYIGHAKAVRELVPEANHSGRHLEIRLLFHIAFNACRTQRHLFRLSWAFDISKTSCKSAAVLLHSLAKDLRLSSSCDTCLDPRSVLAERKGIVKPFEGLRDCLQGFALS